MKLRILRLLIFVSLLQLPSQLYGQENFFIEKNIIKKNFWKKRLFENSKVTTNASFKSKILIQSKKEIKRKNYVKSIYLLNKQSPLDFSNPDNYLVKAKSYTKLGLSSKAITSYKKLFKVQPKNNLILFQIGKLYFQSYKYKNAKSFLNKYLSLCSHNCSKKKEAKFLLTKLSLN